MASYKSSIRYTRPVTIDRPGPQLNTSSKQNNSNDIQPLMSKPNNTQQQPNKPTSETTISISASTSNSSSIQNQTTIFQQKNSTTESLNRVTSINNSPNTSTKFEERPIGFGGQERSISSSGQEQPIVSDGQERSIGSGEQGRPISSGGQKRPHPSQESITFTSQKTSQGGRSRLFIGGIPSDLTQDEFKSLFGKYGDLVEYYVNPARGFGFVKLNSRQSAEQAKHDLDGYILRSSKLRLRFTSQNTIVKVKNLTPNVSNELLKQAFEQFFGEVERAVVLVDDRGKSIGEGIVEFERKPSAQKCLNDCAERCFFITRSAKPIIVEPWDVKDEDDDGVPEKSLTVNDAYYKERELKPRFAAPNTLEYTIGLKWKQLELEEKQLLEEVKKRMIYASGQLQIEIDQMILDHEAQVLRDELARRQEELRRIEELRSRDFNPHRNVMPMHHSGAYSDSVPNAFYQNPAASTAYPKPTPFTPQSFPSDTSYTANQIAHGYNTPNSLNTGRSGIDYNQNQQRFKRKRPKH